MFKCVEHFNTRRSNTDDTILAADLEPEGKARLFQILPQDIQLRKREVASLLPVKCTASEGPQLFRIASQRR